MSTEKRQTRLHTLIMWITHFVGSFVPLIRIIGPGSLTLSLTSITGPVLGRRSSSLWVLFAIGTFQYILLLLNDTPHTLYHWCSVYHIPTLCGTLYWSWIGSSERSPSYVRRLLLSIIPLLCFTIFASHPIGAHAYSYGIWWIIPALSALIPHTHRWLHAFAATLLMHSLGSVLWLFTHTTTASFWIALIPRAIIERLLIATAIVAYEQTIATITDILCQKTAIIDTIVARFEAFYAK